MENILKDKLSQSMEYYANLLVGGGGTLIDNCKVIDFEENISILDKKSVSSNSKLNYTTNIILPIPNKLYFEPKEIILNYSLTYTSGTSTTNYGVNNAYSTVLNGESFIYNDNTMVMKPTLIGITEEGIEIKFELTSNAGSSSRKFTFYIYAMILLGIEIKING